jgi:hypothetical protein
VAGNLGLARLDGYPFVVRHSDGAVERAVVAAEFTSQAYEYLSERFGGVKPDVAVYVLAEADWAHDIVYGMPFFTDEDVEDAAGALVMAAGAGSFWLELIEDLRVASPRTAYPRLLDAYPDGAGGVDLQPFFDLIAVHELAHAFQEQGDLRLPTFWLGEVFANLALHAFVAAVRPDQLLTLEVLPSVGAASRNLATRMRAEGISTLEDLDAHYLVSADEPLSPTNYVWFQYRWQRLVARVFDADGEAALVRLWECFHGRDRISKPATAAELTPLLSVEVSPQLGRAVRDWR